MRVVQRGDGGGAGIISAHVSPEEKVRGWEKVMGIHLSTRCGLLPAGKNKKSFKSKGKLVLNSFFIVGDYTSRSAASQKLHSTPFKVSVYEGTPVQILCRFTGYTEDVSADGAGPASLQGILFSQGGHK